MPLLSVFMLLLSAFPMKMQKGAALGAARMRIRVNMRREAGGVWPRAPQRYIAKCKALSREYRVP